MPAIPLDKAAWLLRAVPVCLLLLPFWVSARETDELFEFAPFIVRGGTLGPVEAPHPVSTVDGGQIQRANRQVALDEALEGIPGVFVLNPYNFAQDTRIAIRGFGARADFGIRGIRLLVDGIPATSPDGQGEVDGIDLGSVGRIRVLRGPASVFYGAASGGVILMETESTAGQPFLGWRMSAGEDGFRHLQAKARGSAGGVSGLVSLSEFRTDGYREHSETENRRLNGKVDYRVDARQRLRLVFNLIDYPMQNDPGGLTREEARADPRQARDRNLRFDGGEEVVQQRVGLQYGYDLAGGGRLEWTTHGTWRDFANRLPFEGGGQVDLDRTVGGSRLIIEQPLEEAFLSGGVELAFQDDHRRNFDNLDGRRGDLVLDQREEVESLGLYLYGRREWIGNLEVSVALRYDRVNFAVGDRFNGDGDDSGSIGFSEWTPMIGLSRRFGEQTLFYANFTSSFETPTTTEFDNPDGGGFNPDLESQVARNLEAGLRGRVTAGDLDVTYDLAVFQIRIDDLLVPYELPESPGREFYRNAGEGFRQGFEAALEARPAGWLRVRIDYTYSDFSYEEFLSPGGDFSGNRIPGIPRHFGGLSLLAESGGGFFASWRTTHTGAFYADDGNRERIRPVTVSRLTVGRRWEKGDWIVEPYLRIDNLFAESHFANIRLNAFGGRHFEPAPGRRVMAGLRIESRF
jgi:iron complex outermembrane receptor protein